MRWKEIPGFSRYEASSDNQGIRVKKTGYILSRNNKQDGYIAVSIYNNDGIRKNSKEHRLVAITFIDNPDDKTCINHKDMDRENNHVENLEWCTHTENIRHSRENNKKRSLGVTKMSKSVLQLKDGIIIKEFKSIAEAGKETNTQRTAIIFVCQGKRKSAGGYQWEYKEVKEIDIEGEVWRKHKDYDNHLISNMGRVKSLHRNMIMVGYIQCGYKRIELDKSRTIHRLVAETFIENPDNKCYINHINGNKLDNRVENLEWCTQSENMQHAHDNGLIKSNPMTKSVYQIKDGKIVNRFESITIASKICCINRSDIIRVCRGKRKKAGGYEWRYVKEELSIGD